MGDNWRLLAARERPLAGRQLLLVVAFVVLLGVGGLDVLPRPGAGSAALSVAPGGTALAVGRQGGPAAGAQRQPPPGASVGRGAPLAAVPARLESAAGPPPIALTGGPVGGPGGRAPPAAAGTDASLPSRP